MKRVPVKYETDNQHSMMANILQQTATTNHPQRERWFPTEADVGGVLLSWWWWAVLYYESPPHTPHCIVQYKRWAIKQHYQTSGSLSSTYIPLSPLTATFQQEEEPCCPNAPVRSNTWRPRLMILLWILFKVKLDPLAKYNELEVRRPKVNNNCLRFFLFRYGQVRLPNPLI